MKVKMFSGVLDDVYVEDGIKPYVAIVNELDNIYTVGSCEGHIYESNHVLYDDNKRTLGWLQLDRLKMNDYNLNKIIELLLFMDSITIDKSIHSELVCIIDPFSGKVPSDYCKVFISEYMWDKYLNNRKDYTLIGIDELVIVAFDGKVVGNYKNTYLSSLLKSRLIMRDTNIDKFI